MTGDSHSDLCKIAVAVRPPPMTGTKHMRAFQPTLKRNGQKGFTMMELLMVVVGAAFLIGLMMVFYNQFMRATGVNKETALLTTMAGKLQSTYQSQGNFQGLTAPVAIQLNAPDRSQVVGTSIMSRWRTPITLASANGGGTANDSLAITYTGVLPEDCSKFVEKVESSFFRIAVNGTNVKDLPTGTQLNVGTMATRCNATPTATIIYTMGLF